DESNRTDVVALAGVHADRVRMFREVDPEGPGEVPDPYYGGEEGFTEVLAMVERCAQAWTEEIARAVGGTCRPAPPRREEEQMARQATVARRAEELLDVAVVSTQPVAGGDICTTTRLRLSDGTLAVMKTRPHAPPTFFPTEAAGLRWLAEVDDGVRVPEVLAV